MITKVESWIRPIYIKFRHPKKRKRMNNHWISDNSIEITNQFILFQRRMLAIRKAYLGPLSCETIPPWKKREVNKHRVLSRNAEHFVLIPRRVSKKRSRKEQKGILETVIPFVFWRLRLSRKAIPPDAPDCTQDLDRIVVKVSGFDRAYTVFLKKIFSRNNTLHWNFLINYISRKYLKKSTTEIPTQQWK